MQTTTQEQFSLAYEEHSDALFRYCLRKINNPETAKDLLQEAFFRAWRHIHQGKEVENIKAFLYKILGNLIIDQYRKRSTDESLETLEEKGFEPGVDNTEQWIDALDGKQALGLLQEIRQPYRDTILMRYVEDLSIREIAGKSHATESAVAVRIHRGMHILQDLFAERMIAHAATH